MAKQKGKHDKIKVPNYKELFNDTDPNEYINPFKHFPIILDKNKSYKGNGNTRKRNAERHSEYLDYIEKKSK